MMSTIRTFLIIAGIGIWIIASVWVFANGVTNQIHDRKTPLWNGFLLVMSFVSVCMFFTVMIRNLP